MDTDRRYVKSILEATKSIRSDIGTILHPSETREPINQPVLPHSLFRNTRGYIEQIVFQINRCYEQTCYDACAVMIRRLIEILIIECFEHQGIASKIKNSSDDYLFLDDLITAILRETLWNLGRNTKAGLRKMKRIGDQSAHSRRYNARREYIDDVLIELRTVTEELLYIANLRK